MARQNRHFNIMLFGVRLLFHSPCAFIFEMYIILRGVTSFRWGRRKKESECNQFQLTQSIHLPHFDADSLWAETVKNAKRHTFAKRLKAFTARKSGAHTNKPNAMYIDTLVYKFIRGKEEEHFRRRKKFTFFSFLVLCILLFYRSHRNQFSCSLGEWGKRAVEHPPSFLHTLFALS